ncbi:MAG TPA: O-antigen ligase family protein, partial [Tenuifilaceae bacterium]|nr:O-antigen ligase family protein [Tenuifilaceae bacterium]
MRFIEELKFIGLFIISIVIQYFFPTVISQVYFGILLILFLISKLDFSYFWVIFFWLLFTSPGYLFYDLGIYKLPTLSIPGMGREIFYGEIFTILLIIKIIFQSVKNRRIFYSSPLLGIIIYAIILLIVGLFSGSSILTVLKSIRFFIPLLLLLFIPRIVPYSRFLPMVQLMFVSVFVLVFAQMYSIVMGEPLAAVLGETQMMFSGVELDDKSRVFDVTQGAVRVIFGAYLLYISLLFSFILLLDKNHSYKSKYFIIITFLSAFSIFMSATRGWIIAIVFIIFGFSLIAFKKFSKSLLIGVMFFFVLLLIPKINMQISNAYERTLTIESLIEGDLTADGTLSRLTERGPKVMEKFYERPIFGFGFSEEYYEFQDVHVGNQ